MFKNQKSEPEYRFLKSFFKNSPTHPSALFLFCALFHKGKRAVCAETNCANFRSPNFQTPPSLYDFQPEGKTSHMVNNFSAGSICPRSLSCQEWIEFWKKIFFTVLTGYNCPLGNILANCCSLIFLLILSIYFHFTCMSLWEDLYPERQDII